VGAAIGFCYIGAMIDRVAPRPAAALIVALGVFALAAAFAFQYLGGLAPCILCIWQRYPYGVAIALGALAFLLAGNMAAARVLIALAGLVLLADAAIAAFHVGVEQKWWAGTAECGGNLATGVSAEDLKAQLQAAPVVRCDEVAWSLFGISMAGYNFLLALAGGLAALIWAARSRSRT
jgi:disulfide bond formation protein DsbB